ncbi:MAG: ComEC/Rec2 family competence protein [Eubacterium sp.]|nr:ComEC/Rec2 family competence protein [Eubacterium sp.]
MIIAYIFFFYDPPHIDVGAVEKKNSVFYGICEEFSVVNSKKIIIKNVTDEYGNLICDKAIVYADTRSEHNAFDEKIHIGNTLKINGTSECFAKPGNPGQFNEYDYYLSLGIDMKIFASQMSVASDETDLISETLFRIRAGFVRVLFEMLPEDKAGMVAAITVGEKSFVEAETKELYRLSGMAHVLAISGLHISVLCYGLFFFLKRYVLDMRTAAVVTGVVTFLYGLMTGFSLSARRAVVMMIIYLVSKVIFQRYDRMNSLALAALIELITHPMSLFQSAFLFSYGTVFGIIVFVSTVEKLDPGRDKSVARILYKAVAGSVGVTIITLPITIWSYHEFSLYGVIANILLLPLLSFLLGGSIVFGMIAFVVPDVGKVLFGSVYYVLEFFDWVCEIIVSLPGNSVVVGERSGVGVMLYYLVVLLCVVMIHAFKGRFSVIAFTRGRVHSCSHAVAMRLKIPNAIASGERTPSYESYNAKTCNLSDVGYENFNSHEKTTTIIKHSYGKHRFMIIIIAVLIINIVILISSIGSGGIWRSTDGVNITNVDVGQGDCAVVRLDNGKNIMIDGGSTDVDEVGRYRIVPFLKYMGISRIDYVFITHSDADHTSGIIEMLENTRLGISISTVVLPGIDTKDENYQKLEAVIKNSGTELRYFDKGDGIIFDDDTGLRCLHPYPQYPYEDVNDYSLVLELRYGRFKGLFTGDVGFAGEKECEALLKDVDYLKVGHHGSKNSSSEEFLKLIRPEIAVASAGKNNRYHHPAKEAVERLNCSGAKLYCTIECGAVNTFSDGKQYYVSQFKE